ncbi:hypothetical protein [Haloferax volcanii]|uniref:hypothetical protein n=1 Tax=Haloferax volcanii TaxID=2246 RepID=UPI003D303165
MSESKSDIFSALKSNLTSQQYSSFLDNLFDAYGKKGDKVNLQFFEASNISYQSLVHTLDSESLVDVITDGGDVEHPSLLKKISDFDIRENQIVDIEFEMQGSNTIIDFDDEGTIRDGSGKNLHIDEINQEEHGLEGLTQYREPNKYAVEARVYTKNDIIAISNSRCKGSVQKQLFRAIRDWSGGEKRPSCFELRENELLLIQHLLNGENCGLDYGGFQDQHISSAKYRGTRKNTLTNSPVLTPASEQGEITQIRFYHTHDDGSGKPRPVQIRLHDDGHFSTSVVALPKLADEVNGCCQSVLDYREYLRTIDDIINDYIVAKDRDSLQFAEGAYRRRKRNAFNDLVEQLFDSNSFDDTEVTVYASVIATIAIWFLEIDLESGQYPNVPTAGQHPEREEEIKELLKDYSDYHLNSTRPNYEAIWNHLAEMIQENNKGSPIDILNTAIENYDL